MAVAFDAVGPGATGSSVTSITWTHTPVGTPSAVGVWFGGYLTAGTLSATYGGTTMTAGTFYGQGPFSSSSAQSFGLANPSSGAKTVVITCTNSAYLSGSSITVTGSDTTTCFRNRNGSNGSVNNSTASVTSATGDLVVDCVGGFQAVGVPSGAGAAQTSRYTAFWNTNLCEGISTQPGATGTVTATWSNVNLSGTMTYATAIDSFQVAGVAPPPTTVGGTLPFMGVG
jgi:hypothetical protein